METNTETLHHNHKTPFEQFMDKINCLKSYHSGIGMLAIQTRVSVKKLENLIESRYISKNLMLQIEAEIDPILNQLKNRPQHYKDCEDKLLRLKEYQQGTNLLVKHCGLKYTEVRGVINGNIPLDPYIYIRINNVIDPILVFLDSQDFNKKTNKKLSNTNDPILKKIEKLKNYRSAAHLLMKASGLSETTVRKLINNKIKLTAFIEKKISPHLDKTLQELEQSEIELNQRKHGNYISYTKGCRCEPCKIAMQHYLINLKHRKSINSSKGSFPVDKININSDDLENYQQANKECLNKLMRVQGYRSGFAMITRRVGVSYAALRTATSSKPLLSNYLYEKISPVIDEILEELVRSQSILENYQQANKECFNKLLRVQAYWTGSTMLTQRAKVSYPTLKAATSGKTYLTKYLYKKISPVIDEVLEDLERLHSNGGLGKHGKYTTYANDKCRCIHCKAARVNYTKAFKERKASKSAPSHS